MTVAGVRLLAIWHYLLPYRKAIAAGVVALVALNLIGVWIPLVARDVVDGLAPGFTTGELVRGALALIGLATVMAVLRLLSRMLVFGVGREAELNLRQQIFEHLLRQEPGWLAEMRAGEVISRSTYDVENVRRLLGFASLNLVNTAMVYGLQLPVMLAIDVELTIAAVAVYPLLFLVVRLFGGRMMRLQRRQQECQANLSDLIQEDLTGISAIKIYSQQANEHDAFDTLNRRYRNAALALAGTRSVLFPMLEKIGSISLLILLALGASRLEAGADGRPDALTVGTFVALLLYAERLVFPTTLLGFTLNTLQTGQVSLDRVEQLLSRQPQINDPAVATDLVPEPAGRLVVKDLSFAYPGSNRLVLDGLSFTLDAGELVALVGAVGCGKSTLARALGLMINVQPGCIFLDDQDVTQLRLKDLRSRIAMVPQEAFLFTATLEDNVRYGKPDVGRPAVETVARAAQLRKDIAAFPRGLDTLVGERGVTLSGGQRQRTALARALLLQSPLLILDDALASVDNATAAGILQDLRSNHRNRCGNTVLFITHQLSAAAACDRVMVMDAGHVVQLGGHAELMAEAGPYRQLWDRQTIEDRM